MLLTNPPHARLRRFGTGTMLRHALTAALVLAACQQPEQTNCPDKYEGQTLTVAGKIMKTASFLGLATVTTIQDTKSGVCLVISKSSVGNEGADVRLTNMVAIHDEKTIVPNFLRPASENVSAVATSTLEPFRTLAPTATPTPQPAIVQKAGTPVTYTDGWTVVVLRSEPQPPARFSTPAPGMQFVAVIVGYENRTAKEASFNRFNWKLQDSSGVRRNGVFFTGRNDALNSGQLAPGGFVQGSIVFEAPTGDSRLSVIYEDFGYKQATWELY